MPDIKDMFAERLKLQQRVMEVLAPIVREQVAIEAAAEAAMRQTYVVHCWHVPGALAR